MARKRMIDPSLWADPSFGRMSAKAQIFFIGMFCNADDDGRLPADPVFLKSTILPFEPLSKEEAIAIRGEVLKNMKSLVLYSRDGEEYLQFNKYRQYQYIQKPQDSKYPSPDDPNVVVSEEYRTSNVGVSTNRIEKNRIEKKRREEASPSFLENIPEPILEQLHASYEVSKIKIKEKAISLLNYCKAHGKQYRDYSAVLRNALSKDFGPRKTAIPIDSTWEYDEATGKYKQVVSSTDQHGRAVN